MLAGVSGPLLGQSEVTAPSLQNFKLNYVTCRKQTLAIAKRDRRLARAVGLRCSMRTPYTTYTYLQREGLRWGCPQCGNVTRCLEAPAHLPKPGSSQLCEPGLGWNITVDLSTCDALIQSLPTTWTSGVPPPPRGIVARRRARCTDATPT